MRRPLRGRRRAGRQSGRRARDLQLQPRTREHRVVRQLVEPRHVVREEVAEVYRRAAGCRAIRSASAASRAPTNFFGSIRVARCGSESGSARFARSNRREASSADTSRRNRGTPNGCYSFAHADRRAICRVRSVCLGNARGASFRSAETRSRPDAENSAAADDSGAADCATRISCRNAPRRCRTSRHSTRRSSRRSIAISGASRWTPRWRRHATYIFRRRREAVRRRSARRESRTGQAALCA